MQKIYIAGPMTGYPEFNFESFFKARKRFIDYGIHKSEIYNPAQADLDRGLVVTGTAGNISEIPDFDLKLAMTENCKELCQCSHIFMLKGWEKSPGSKAEHALAVCLGLEIEYQ